MALGTFKTSKELINPIPSIFPEHWSLAGYIEAFSRYRIWDNLYNTFFFCVTIIAVQTVTNTMAAYALSKIKPKGSNAIYILMLGTQMISTTAVLFPKYLMITKMGLIGNKWSRVLISSTWAYAIVLYKNFFDSVPSDLIEAAEIDGAGEFRKIINIIMPLSKPVYAVCILNTFMGVYNDFLFPLHAQFPVAFLKLEAGHAVL